MELKTIKSSQLVEKEINCLDCLCRVCAHNECGEGEGCTGCGNCNGVIASEEECVNSRGFEYCGD